MTTERRELIIEGSLDGDTWFAYEFPFKPGPPGRVPLWATPHQPRLDWQMWFAALRHPDATPWMWEFVFALLESRRPVLRLIDDPFGGKRPRFLRILSRTYRFTESAERREDGRWWQVGPAQIWLEPVRLRTPKVSHGPLTLDGRNTRPERDGD
jgi:hypothetical protein